ncbi:MAG: WbqC family protein [Nitrosopumilaceae archaeon]
MKAVIHQPQFFPYPGFFHKISLADCFVIMDDVQYDKRFTNRTRIVSTNGWIWVTIPINKSQKFSPNMEVEINNELPWIKDHLKKFVSSYGKSPYFDSYMNYIEEVYKKEWEFLFDLNFETLKKTMEWLNIKTEIIRESELNIKGESSERLLNVCKEIGADSYISGIGGKNYVDEKLFENNHVQLLYQNYCPTKYPQRFLKEFFPNLSILDMLFNIGPKSTELINENNSEKSFERI